MTTDRDYDRDHEKAHDHGLDARDVRALEEEMTVCEHLGHVRGEDGAFIVVSESGSEYTVNTREATCSCPDHEYHDVHCKHLRRVTLETGMRPVRAAHLDALDVSDQFDGEHVDGAPVVVRPQGALEATADVADRAVATDGGRDVDHEDGDDCECDCDDLNEVDAGDPLTCWTCYRRQSGGAGR